MANVPSTAPQYTLIRSRKRRKTITLHVQGDGNIIIRAPWSTPRREIDAFFTAKVPWLTEKLSLREKHAKDLGSGKELLYLGTSYPLEVLPQGRGPESIIFSGHQFHLRCDHEPRRRAIIVGWYRKQAEDHFEQRVAHYARVTGQSPAGFRLSDARHRWGSCSPHNRLSLNWRLVMAPPPVVDYVVVHELTHIAEKSHSPRFWDLVAKTIPDYGKRRRRLKEYGFIIAF